MRYAIYFTPPRHDPLTRAGAAWLGRDAFTGEPLQPTSGPLPAGLARYTAKPRRYGFHATLKAPFRLAPGLDESELQAALDEFGATVRPVIIPRLAIDCSEGFFALVPERPVPEVDALAASVVEAFDGFRAPLTPEDRARRRPERLTEAQRANLERWGYPRVFGEFAFHMTLTDGVPDEERETVLEALRKEIGPALDRPVEIAALALFVEPEPGADFLVRSLHPLRAR